MFECILGHRASEQIGPVNKLMCVVDLTYSHSMPLFE